MEILQVISEARKSLAQMKREYNKCSKYDMVLSHPDFGVTLEVINDHARINPCINKPIIYTFEEVQKYAGMPCQNFRIVPISIHEYMRRLEESLDEVQNFVITKSN